MEGQFLIVSIQAKFFFLFNLLRLRSHTYIQTIFESIITYAQMNRIY